MVSIGKQPSYNFETLRFFWAGLFAVRKKPHSYDTELQKKNSICTLSDIFCEPPLEGWSWSWLWSDLQADLGVEVSVSPVEGEVLVLCTEHSGARHYCCGSNCSPTAKYWEIFLTLRVKREKEKAGEEVFSYKIFQNILTQKISTRSYFLLCQVISVRVHSIRFQLCINRNKSNISFHSKFLDKIQ